MRVSCGSPCEFDRAFVDPDTGHTTCVWQAPSLDEVRSLFTEAKVEVTSIKPVTEMTTVGET